jgi:hypothetical protein
VYYRAGLAEYPFKRTGVDISQLAVSGADLNKEEQLQPAPKRMRPGPEPGKTFE